MKRDLEKINRNESEDDIKREIEKYENSLLVVFLFWWLWGKRQIEDTEYAKKNDKYVREYNLNNLELFLRIDIETINRCDGTCSFYPVMPKKSKDHMQR